MLTLNKKLDENENIALQLPEGLSDFNITLEILDTNDQVSTVDYLAKLCKAINIEDFNFVFIFKTIDSMVTVKKDIQFNSIKIVIQKLNLSNFHWDVLSDTEQTSIDVEEFLRIDTVVSNLTGGRELLSLFSEVVAEVKAYENELRKTVNTTTILSVGYSD